MRTAVFYLVLFGGAVALFFADDLAENALTALSGDQPGEAGELDLYGFVHNDSVNLEPAEFRVIVVSDDRRPGRSYSIKYEKWSLGEELFEVSGPFVLGKNRASDSDQFFFDPAFRPSPDLRVSFPVDTVFPLLKAAQRRFNLGEGTSLTQFRSHIRQEILTASGHLAAGRLDEFMDLLEEEPIPRDSE